MTTLRNPREFYDTREQENSQGWGKEQTFKDTGNSSGL